MAILTGRDLIRAIEGEYTQQTQLAKALIESTQLMELIGRLMAKSTQSSAEQSLGNDLLWQVAKNNETIRSFDEHRFTEEEG